ncbi:hypothetical protein ACFSWE_15395 [Leucobacter albus]|uniref:Uncharacterized protein n=1 Tax=Leucobacter albus TaxID=272210 RepID=A0ABW3TRJ8_9MICO
MSVAVGGLTGAVRGGAWANGLMAPMPTGVPNIAPDIVGWALSYVQPLEAWFHELLGDPGQVEGVAASWEQVESTLVGVADELSTLEQELGSLVGRTVRTLELRYEDLKPVARDAADWSGAVAAAARLASRVVAGVRQFIFDFLDRLARLIGALFGFTLNPFEKVEQLYKLASAAAELIMAGRELIANMLGAFADLAGLLQKLGPVIDEALTRLRETLALMLPVAGGLVLGLPGVILGGAKRDALTASGDVKRYDDEALRNKLDKVADNVSDSTGRTFPRNSLDSLADLVQANSLTDRLGEAGSTAIDVKLVRGPDGSEHWVVSLPSTQQWFDIFGGGAMNDLNTNAALMLEKNPEMASQYERAVMRAMREAGMSAGDPVVFTGFSQGGIMAAKLAENTNLPYTTIGVVTNGSPIDTFNIPPHIPVIAFQHKGDVVPSLDFNSDGATLPNVRRVELPAPSGEGENGKAHNNNNYAASIDLHAAGVSAEYSWMGGEIIDHQVFESVQR